MKILIQKVNNGVLIGVPTASGSMSKAKVSKDDRKALLQAEEWYRHAVTKAFKDAGLADIGYAKNFADIGRSYGRTVPNGIHIPLEPMGFALPGGVMLNTGSSPTEGRAKVLAIYQKPLKAVKAGAQIRFELVKDF